MSTCLGPSLSMSYGTPGGADGSVGARSCSIAMTSATACIGSSRAGLRHASPLRSEMWQPSGWAARATCSGCSRWCTRTSGGTATVVALEPAETLAIRRSTFMRLQAAHPAVRDAVDQLLATRLAAITDRLVEALYTPVAARVRFHLIQLAALYGDLEAGEVTIPLSQDSCRGPLGHDSRDGQPRPQAGAGTWCGEARAGAYRRHPGAPACASTARCERRRRAADEGPTVADPSSVGVKRRAPPTRTPVASPARRRHTTLGDGRRVVVAAGHGRCVTVVNRRCCAGTPTGALRYWATTAITPNCR